MLNQSLPHQSDQFGFVMWFDGAVQMSLNSRGMIQDDIFHLSGELVRRGKERDLGWNLVGPHRRG